MQFIESKNETYLKIRKTGLLTKGQIEFLSYLYRFGPSTTNELVSKVEKERTDLSRNALELFDRQPAELKKWNVIKILEKRKCSITGRQASVLGVTNIIPKIKVKVSGVTKEILNSSMNSALLAVEIYNKPRSTFKSEAYITLMVIAWTKAFHSFFRGTLGDKYFYTDKSNRPIIIDGEKKRWELQTCISRYGKLTENVRKNLEFFIPLRNKIEHAHIDSKEVDTVIFGECQALLMNYENFIIENFGEQYSLNESLAFSLQFSHMRSEEQKIANKNLMLPKVKDLYNYVETYRKGLPQTVLSSQEFRVKVQLVPVISNTSSSDLPVEFLKLDSDQIVDGRKLTTVIKEKVIERGVVGKGTLIHTDVYNRVNERISEETLTSHLLNAFNFVFSIKPMKFDEKKPEETNTKYCEYHVKFNRYQYTEDYVDLLVYLIKEKEIDLKMIAEKYKSKEKIDLDKILKRENYGKKK